MFLKRIDGLRHSLAFRLAAWHALTFAIGTAILFALSYFLLSSAIRRLEHENILVQLDFYRAEYDKNRSVNDLAQLIGEEQGGEENTYLVRFAAQDNRTLFARIPPRWSRAVIRQLEDNLPNNEIKWSSISENEREMEVAAKRLNDDTILQVGADAGMRHETLRLFREAFWLTALAMALLGMAGGVLVATQGVQPLQALAQTVRNVIATGDTGARVSTPCAADEIGLLVLEFNVMLERIETLIRGMRESLDNVAHDLRTPLARLRIIAEQALQSSDNHAHRDALASCVEETENIQTMLKTLMDISEAETGAMRLTLESVQLSVAIGEIIEVYEFVAEEKSISITTAVSDTIRLMADRNRLRQALANLVDNALKYTPERGAVSIRAEIENNWVIISVQDTGVGIGPNDLSKIWRRLYRADQSRSQNGLGLGLSLVQAVVLAHHGQVDVASDVGEGSIFIIRLPVSGATPMAPPDANVFTVKRFSTESLSKK